MSSPTIQDMARLKRLGRYLKGHMRTTTMYEWQKSIDTITVNTDANWAGDKGSRKSTSGGCIMIGTHLTKSWSKGQSLIALSSAESELYARIKAVSEGLGIMSIYKDMDQPMRGHVWADASAALGIISRKGLGKVRHLDTAHLWIQEVNAKRNMEFSKIAGCDNIADLMTKNLTSNVMMKHFHSMGLIKNGERCEIASQTVGHIGQQDNTAITKEGEQSTGEMLTTECVRTSTTQLREKQQCGRAFKQGESKECVRTFAGQSCKSLGGAEDEESSRDVCMRDAAAHWHTQLRGSANDHMRTLPINYYWKMNGTREMTNSECLNMSSMHTNDGEQF